MRFERQSGVFLHPTSLPSPHGVGDLGEGARAFVDFLASADQSLWQFCPLGPVSGAHGNSPYQSPSALAGNPLLIDLRPLVDRGYLTAAEIDPPAALSDHEVEYDRVRAFKQPALRTAFERFNETADDSERESFEQFCAAESAWLEDYALFVALKEEFDGAIWTEWPDPIQTHSPAAVARHREEREGVCRFRVFLPLLFGPQGCRISADARQRAL